VHNNFALDEAGFAIFKDAAQGWCLGHESKTWYTNARGRVELRCQCARHRGRVKLEERVTPVGAVGQPTRRAGSAGNVAYMWMEKYLEGHSGPRKPATRGARGSIRPSRWGRSS